MVSHLSLALTVSIRWRLLFPTLCWFINTKSMIIIIISVLMPPLLGHSPSLWITRRRTGCNPPRGSNAIWWVITTAIAAGNKYIQTFLVTHTMTDQSCLCCLIIAIATECTDCDHRAPLRDGFRVMDVYFVHWRTDLDIPYSWFRIQNTSLTRACFELDNCEWPEYLINVDVNAFTPETDCDVP
jgi:hypothetical protein